MNNMEEERDIQIDPELWLHFLLALKSDKNKWRELQEQVGGYSGLNLEKVEHVLDSLLEILLKKVRSN